MAITHNEEDIAGVKPNVAQAIEKMLVSGRRYFGSAGASLTHQLDNPEQRGTAGFKPELVSKGLAGERDTSLKLREIMEKYPNAVLCDSVHILGDEEVPDDDDDDVNFSEEEIVKENGFVDNQKDTDHVLIIGSSVFIIDTKRWRKKAQYTISPKGSVLRNGKNFAGGKVRAKQAGFLWKKYLPEGVKVAPIVVVNNEEVTTFRTRDWFRARFKIVELPRLEELIEETLRSNKENGEDIRLDIVAKVVVSCIAPYDSYKEFLKKSGITEDII